MRFTGRIALCFAVSAAASVGLAVVYALGGQPQLEGALLGLALGGFSVGFILWGKHLMPQGPFVEEREPLAPSAVDRAAAERDFTRSEEALPRRKFLVRALVGALAALGAALVFPIRSLGPRPGRSMFTTAWDRGRRLVTKDGLPVRASEMVEGGVLTVFPEDATEEADAQVILVRVDPAEYRPPADREDWAPEGLIAYSKICTHAGCPVGLYERVTNRLFCPCHQSVFDVLDAARPTSGPATRPLPQLPLDVDDDGYVIATGDFSEPVGPSWWDYPTP